jgi:adenylate cyclase
VPAPRAHLHYVSSGRRIERPIDGESVRLGRSPKLEVVFSESESGVSRHHATILRVGEAWIIEDAESRNGTFVNGAKVDRAELNDGDRIDLGPFLLTFHVEPPEDVERPTISESMFIRASGIPRVEWTPGVRTTDGHESTAIDLKAVEESVSWRADPARLEYDTMPGEGSVTRDRAWAITLFKEVGRALTVATDLDEMLETIMILAFEHVPAERGVICLVDTAGELDTRVVRAESTVAAHSIQFSRTIVQEALDNQTALLVKDTGGDERFNGAQSIIGHEAPVRSAMCVPLYHEERTAGVIYVDTANRRSPFTESQLELLVGLAIFGAIAIGQFELREKALQERLKREKLCRYHTPAVVDRILAGGAGDAGMLASKEDVTVLFADLKGFTAMSETMSPTEVVAVLNTVFGRLVESVFRNRGTLDKFMGDGMLAYFGAPLQLENHALAAVRAALEMQRAIRELNAEGQLPVELGLRIGLNSGPTVVGDVGSATQSNHTVIGDTVNIASRLESSVAEPGWVVVGPETYARVKGVVEALPLEPVMLKGKREPLRPYRILADPVGRDSEIVG